MTRVNTPTSWKEFFIAVEQMRECQKEYIRTKTFAAHKAVVLCELTVDAGIKYIREKWERESRPELPKGGSV